MRPGSCEVAPLLGGGEMGRSRLVGVRGRGCSEAGRVAGAGQEEGLRRNKAEKAGTDTGLGAGAGSSLGLAGRTQLGGQSLSSRAGAGAGTGELGRATESPPATFEAGEL